MCWKGNKKEIRRKIAKEDMIVLKLCIPATLKNGVISSAFEHYYEKDKVQPKIKLRAKLGERWMNSYFSPREEGPIYTIAKGYHSYKFDANRSWKKNDSYNLFIIPKGTKYVQNRLGDIVSETIKYVK